MKVILNSEQIEQILKDLTSRIISETPPELELAVVGIRSRGEVLGQRLSSRLTEELGRDVPCGTLDITLYRDDLNSPQSSAQPQVRTTEIGFDIDDKIVILFDDVLYTGRSTRAAMDALRDLGRPKAIKLRCLLTGPEESCRYRLIMQVTRPMLHRGNWSRFFFPNRTEKKRLLSGRLWR